MFTNFALVGTVAEMPVIINDQNGIADAHVKISCERAYPDVDGVYHYDEFIIYLWRGIAEQCADACQIGSVIGLKGRLESRLAKDEKGELQYVPTLIAERVRIIRV